MQSNKNKSIDFKSSVFTCNKLNCSGCGACAQICSKHAIDMVEDNEGFLFPILNQEKCVQCGLCDKICPEVNSHQSNVGEYKQCFAATNKDNDYSRMSATIGACTMMAEYVLSIGGYVFGVILDEDEWKAKHRCIDNYFLLQEARNSKYIQSDTGSTYSLAKQLLNKDKTVLFDTSSNSQIDEEGLTIKLKGQYKIVANDYKKGFVLYDQQQINLAYVSLKGKVKFEKNIEVDSVKFKDSSLILKNEDGIRLLSLDGKPSLHHIRAFYG